MEKENINKVNTSNARKRIMPMGIGVTMGIVLGVALGNIAMGLVVGIVLAGIVIVIQRKK